MFHKEGSYNTALGKKAKDTPVRKSDRRKLKTRFLSAIQENPANDDDTETSSSEMWALVEQWLDEILLNSQSEILIRKIKRQNATSNAGATTIYLRTPSSTMSSSSTDILWPYPMTQPIFIETSSSPNHTRLLPTVALLSVLPWASSPLFTSTIMNSRMVLVPPIVSKYLCRGADLMRSGMLSLPTGTTTPDWVCIQAQGNVQPFAVGILTENTTSMESIGAGTKGVGVDIVTCYGDDLWQSQNMMVKRDITNNASTTGDDGEKRRSEIGGGFYQDGDYGNVGFLEGEQVYALQQIDSDDDDDDDDDDDNEDSGSSVVKDDENDGSNLIASLSVQEDKEGTDSSEIKQSNEEIGKTNNDSDDNGGDDDDDENDAEKDLHDAFYTSILNLSPKSDLPMPTSTFYTQFLLPARKEGTFIDLKDTRYKKIGTFLLEQAKRGVIGIGASKEGNDPVAMLLNVDKTHQDLREARMLRKEQAQDDTGSTSTKKKKKGKMAIINLYVIPQNIVSSLQLDKNKVKAQDAKSEDRRGTGYLTAPESRAIINDYILSNNLVDEFDPEVVQLNGPLFAALFRPNKREISAGYDAPAEEVTRKDLNEKWMSKMESAYAIVKMPGSQIISMKRGKPPTVSIEVEFRQGNRKKFLTHIRGLEEYGINGSEFSKDVSKRFACSGTVEDKPVGRANLKKGCVEIVFQGHLLEELQALLSGNDKLSSHGGAKGAGYCLPKGSIDVVLRKGVPKRKRS